MELTTELGVKIINETKRLINEQIIIVNKQAIIIASTDHSRIGDFHEGADQTIKNNVVMVLTQEHEKTLKGVRAGINLPIAINNKVIGVIGITGDPLKVTPFGSLMQKMTVLLIQESMFIQESEWKDRAIENFIFEWLQMDTISTELIQQAEIVGVDVHSKRRCILISLHRENTAPLSPAIAQFKLWLEQIIDGIVIKWGNDQLLILSREESFTSNKRIHFMITSIQNYVTDTLKVDVSVGIGNIVKPHLIKHSHSEAEKALKVAKNDSSVVFYHDLLLEICLNDVHTQTKEKFVQRVLKPIHDDPVLLNTLKSFLENDLQMKTTAAKLHIHVNTLHYRLKRIHQLTNLDPKITENVAAFFIAYYFLDD